MIELVREFFGCKATWREWGRYGYDRSVVWEAYELAIYYRDDISNGDPQGGRSCVQFTGKALASLSPVQIRELVDRLSGKGFKATRLDLAFDDFEKRVSPSEVNDFCEMGTLAGFRKFHLTETKMTTGDTVVEAGSTVAFGGRGKSGSGKYLRCYDKAAESGGKVDAIRWEVEFTKDSAQLAFSGLTNTATLAEFTALIGALVAGSIDFVDRSTGDRLSRCKRLEWWQGIVEELGRCVMRPRRKGSSVEASEKWVGTQVAATLAMVREARGADHFDAWLLACVDGAQLSGRHESLIEEHRRSAKAEVEDFFEEVF